MDDIEDDIHTSLHHVDHHKPQKLSVGDAFVSSAEAHRHFERRIAVSSVETRGLSVTQSEAGMPGVEAVTGVRSLSILHSLPLSVDLDQGWRLGPRGVHTQCPHCRAFIVTRTEATLGLFACLSSGLCCLSG